MLVSNHYDAFVKAIQDARRELLQVTGDKNVTTWASFIDARLATIEDSHMHKLADAIKTSDSESGNTD